MTIGHTDIFWNDFRKNQNRKSERHRNDSKPLVSEKTNRQATDQGRSKGVGNRIQGQNSRNRLIDFRFQALQKKPFSLRLALQCFDFRSGRAQNHRFHHRADRGETNRQKQSYNKNKNWINVHDGSDRSSSASQDPTPEKFLWKNRLQSVKHSKKNLTKVPPKTKRCFSQSSRRSERLCATVLTAPDICPTQTTFLLKIQPIDSPFCSICHRKLITLIPFCLDGRHLATFRWTSSRFCTGKTIALFQSFYLTQP